MKGLGYLYIAATAMMLLSILYTPEPKAAAKKHCTGYEVVDCNHVRTCDGDTIFYDWRQDVRLYKLKQKDPA
jgi:hypothetical protein